MATAYALGAPYPEDLEQDKFALLCFRCVVSRKLRIASRPAIRYLTSSRALSRLLLLLQHGIWYRKGSNRESAGVKAH